MRAAGFIAFATTLALACTNAHADLCDSVIGTVTPVTPGIDNDVKLFEGMFPDAPGTSYLGDRRWNQIILQCNRQRDSKGEEVLKLTGSSPAGGEKDVLKAANLEPKVVRGHYNFVGLAGFKYVYMLAKTEGVWTMTIPYKPVFVETVPGRVDFDVSHAGQLYDASQVANPADKVQVFRLKADAKPISTTLCASSTYFPGEQGRYDGKAPYQRDDDNKFISLGAIQYQYENGGNTYRGCRVDKRRDLYWRWDAANAQAVKVTPQGWILDNFIRTAESYWSIPKVFRLKLLVEGHNDASFPSATRNLFEPDDHLTVHFATKFLRAHFNQMYKTNVWQPNNFSTMTIDSSYWHEVGHAFGLDDEYGFFGDDGKKSCKNKTFTGLYDTLAYQMCDGGATDKRTVYHYIAASRYLTKQKECNADNDCGSGEFCNAGIDTKKNRCEAKKVDDEACALVGGDHQCRSGACRAARCYTPKSVAMGDVCWVNDACKQGHCSSPDGTRGTCVCDADGQCGTGQYCDTGIDTTKNRCIAVKEDDEPCALIGGGHQCKSGQCGFGRCFTPRSVGSGGTCWTDDACKQGHCSAIDGTRGTCVCDTDAQCGAGFWCDAGVDTKVNACRRKLDKGESCAGVAGNDHKCKSGECSGFPDYRCK